LDASIHSSILWNEFSILRLHDPVQNACGPAYSYWVDQVSEGLIENTFLKAIHLPMIERLKYFENVVSFLFSPEILHDPSNISSRAFVNPSNRFVDEFNKLILDRISFVEGKILF
jgi:hypothetical protein